MARLTTTMAAAALLAMAAPGMAATGLDCVESGHDPEAAAVIEAFVDGVDFRTLGSPPPEFEAALATRAQACAATHGWSPEAVELALRYQRARHLDIGLRRNAPIGPEAQVRLDAAIDAADENQLLRTMTLMVANRNSGQVNFGTADLAVMLPIIRASGLPMNRETGRFIGSWLMLRFTLRNLPNDFAAL